MTLDYAAAEGAGLCECGQQLDNHAPLPAPKPWATGRPCSKTALQRGYGWDGRPAVEHTPGQKSRWTGYGTGIR